MVYGDRANIRGPFPQGRYRKADTLNAKEKIAAKRTARHHLLYFAVGGRRQPEIAGNLLPAARGQTRRSSSTRRKAF